MERVRWCITLIVLLFLCPSAGAQRFFNLTAPEVRIDSVLPRFGCSIPLGEHYQDSLYTVSIAYPEFIKMGHDDVLRVQQLIEAPLPEMPVIEQFIAVDRKRGSLELSFVPLVLRDGQYQKLVSFMIDVKATPIHKGRKAAPTTRAGGVSDRYAAHSVLATGHWAKIRIPATGIYQLTETVIKKAGFSDLAKVRIYGYGGELQPEALTDSYLRATDDLQELPTCTIGGRRLFFGRGPVSWSSPSSTIRTRNPYSDYGYYFITQGDAEPLQIDSATFISTYYPSADDYHVLYEKDEYAWYEGGRNLYEGTAIEAGQSKTYQLPTHGQASGGSLRVVLTTSSAATASVELNGEQLGTQRMATSSSYDHAAESASTYQVSNLQAQNELRITVASGSTPVRVDYLSLALDTPRPLQLATTTFDSPEYVYNITNQDHHADGPCDMVIIVPLTGKLTAQAERIKTMHEQRDGLSVRIVPADELYNEFSSGTPDASAYRRYMKMLYDRAQTEAEMPRYLMLFGDCAWDNRMHTSAWTGYTPDDFLLCYESENSFSSTQCYVSEDFFCLLDDGETLLTGNSYRGKPDIAVGRFPVRNAEQAKILTDKTLAYVNNQNAGIWQNTIMFLGDDGNSNQHMIDADKAAGIVAELNPGIVEKKVMWDAYTREVSSTGATYPEVTKAIVQQQQAGALIIDYCGHGRADQLSHEMVVGLTHFENFTNENLPLWITASCDIMPFDSQTDNIGEAAVLNDKGGAVAFFGTTRTVYQDRNQLINNAFLRNLFTPVDGSYITIGEAQRKAKNDLVNGYIYDPYDPKVPKYDNTQNKLQYSLLGDPALRLNIPSLSVVVDAINGEAVTASSMTTLKAGQVATVSGHIEANGLPLTDFNGTVTATVRDSEEEITCKLNDTSSDGAQTPFVYKDRTKTLFSGSDEVRNGQFTFSFAVPMDINYTDGTGLINLFAVSSDHLRSANGCCERFKVGSTDTVANDSIGPSVYCYLNSPSFSNGDDVNSTPYFVAEITDKDGINTTGNGIGHDLELTIDGLTAMTYNLNGNFQYDFGSYTSGTTYYSIPELTAGRHRLTFRAWDVLNNATTTELTFNVVRGLEPHCFGVSCTKNPAVSETTFIISHDRTGSELDVELEVYDFAGRLLWRHHESGVPATGTYTLNWNLSTDGGSRLQTGVYLYRVRISSDGSSQASKAQKLIIIGNK